MSHREPIVVTGANGNVGAPLVERLVALDQPVRAAVHGSADGFAPGVQVVDFDFTDPGTWPAAFGGARALFVLRPPHISDVESDIFPALEAALEAGVEHVVTLSVMGAGDNPFLPHRRIEKQIEASEVGYTHIRPGFFMQNLTGAHRAGIRKHDEVIVPAGTGRANFVDTRDVADVAAVALAEGEPHFGRAYEPTGPEALDYHAVAEALSAVLGRTITYNEPGLIAYIRHMREDTDYELGFILFSCLLHTIVRMGRSERVTEDVRKVTGRPPRSMRQFVEDHADVWR